VVGPYAERPEFVGLPDHGDVLVDGDFHYSRDEITIRIPASGTPLRPAELIRYTIGSFDGNDFVLLREVTVHPGATNAETTLEPVVFDIVSLDLLAWNVNVTELGDPAFPTPGGVRHPYWASEFIAAEQLFPTFRPYSAPFGVPPLEFPAAMLISVTVNAERMPMSEIAAWPLGTRGLATQTLSSVVAIESVIKDVRYQLYVRPNG
jgi:hypothetical protein